jgi:hypothetical protein
VVVKADIFTDRYSRCRVAHTHHYGAPLASEFWLLVQSLDDMAQRWQATTGDNFQRASVFQRLAGRLKTMQASLQLNPSQKISTYGPLYEPEHEEREPSLRHWVTPGEMSTYIERARADLTEAALPASYKPPFAFGDDVRNADGIAMNSNEEVGSLSVLPWDVNNNVDLTEPGLDNESLLAISQALTSQDFTSIDRIVAFDNVMLGSFF